VAELHRLGLRRAVRIGRAWALDGGCAPASSWRPPRCVAATAPAGRSARRAHRADAALTAALAGDRPWLLASADVERATMRWDGLAFDLESAAVLARRRRAGIAGGVPGGDRGRGRARRRRRAPGAAARCRRWRPVRV
jgi:hypothetical protein